MCSSELLTEPSPEPFSGSSLPLSLLSVTLRCRWLRPPALRRIQSPRCSRRRSSPPRPLCRTSARPLLGQHPRTSQHPLPDEFARVAPHLPTTASQYRSQDELAGEGWHGPNALRPPTPPPAPRGDGTPLGDWHARGTQTAMTVPPNAFAGAADLAPPRKAQTAGASPAPPSMLLGGHCLAAGPQPPAVPPRPKSPPPPLAPWVGALLPPTSAAGGPASAPSAPTPAPLAATPHPALAWLGDSPGPAAGSATAGIPALSETWQQAGLRVASRARPAAAGVPRAAAALRQDRARGRSHAPVSRCMSALPSA